MKPHIGALLKALGAEKVQGDGSRVAFVLNGRVLGLHRPHPKPELKNQVEDVREFPAGLGHGPRNDEER